jgi:hypothetical protein
MPRARLPSLLVIVLASNPALSAGQEAGAPCAALAAHVKTVVSDPRTFHGAGSFDAESVLTPLINRVHKEPADADLIEKAAKLFGENADNLPFELEHVEGAVWRAYWAQGTAHCVDERFFSLGEDGVPRVIATPAIYGDLCSSSMRSVGTVAGKLALIELEYREHPFQGLDLVVTPWSGDWRPACEVSIRFRDAFRVTEKFCHDRAVCRAAVTLAPKLAEAFARDTTGKTLGDVAPAAVDDAATLAARLKAAKKKLDEPDPRNTILPSFGIKPRTEWPNYSLTYALTWIGLGGKNYLARVGIGGPGWREIGDSLIAVYEDAPSGLKPMASVVVQRHVTGLRSVKTSVPRAYGDSH